MASKTSKKGVLRLPVQYLNWGRIPPNTNKVIFQFDISVAGNGRKIFSFTAYAVRWAGKKWIIGEKIKVFNVPGKKRIELPVPITLGNVELNCSDLSKWGLTKQSKLMLIPRLYKANEHAALIISDGTSIVLANPSPPARPQEAS